jgi:hypothetical protein
MVEILVTERNRCELPPIIVGSAIKNLIRHNTWIENDIDTGKDVNRGSFLGSSKRSGVELGYRLDDKSVVLDRVVFDKPNISSDDKVRTFIQSKVIRGLIRFTKENNLQIETEILIIKKPLERELKAAKINNVKVFLRKTLEY